MEGNVDPVNATRESDLGQTTRAVLWLLAAEYVALGAATAAWGTNWFLAERALASLAPHGWAVPAGVACVMAGAASVRDERARLELVPWILVAHAVVVIPAVVPTDLAFYVVVALLLGLAAWRNPEPGSAFQVTTLLGRRPMPTAALRSSYEQRIREAASLEERHRLARDLHDSIKQQVFVMQTAAATAQARLDDDPQGASAALDQIREAGREATAEMEAMLDQLRVSVLENNGLVEALERQGDALRFRTGSDVRVEVGALPPSHTWPPGSHLAVLRVAQEALANVGRHARASHVWLTLSSTDSAVVLTVRDDGTGRKGSGTGHAGMGIRNMRDRAEEFGGTLSLDAPVGGGTRVVLAIPYAAAGDLAALRRHVIWLAALIAGLGVGIAVLPRAESLIPLLALNGGFLGRAIVKYRRVVRLKNSTSWTPSPSPSSTTTASSDAV